MLSFINSVFDWIIDQFVKCPKHIMPNEVANKAFPEVMHPDEVSNLMWYSFYWIATIFIAIAIIWIVFHVLGWLIGCPVCRSKNALD